MATDPIPDARDRILAAALAVLAEQGVACTTMRAVARRAGVATGLANYHFRSKQALLAAVIEASRSRFLGELAARTPNDDGPRTLRRLLELSQALIALDPTWFPLCADIDALALRHAAFATPAAASKRAGEASIELRLRQVAAAFGAAPPPMLAAVLLAALDGLAVRRLIDPAFDLAAAYRLVERMILAQLAPGRAPLKRPWDKDPLGLRRARR